MKNIAHCDIKPENILLKIKENLYKICDVGISKIIINKDTNLNTI
jgi:serine/threonine protein kinase